MLSSFLLSSGSVLQDDDDDGFGFVNAKDWRRGFEDTETPHVGHISTSLLSLLLYSQTTADNQSEHLSHHTKSVTIDQSNVGK